MGFGDQRGGADDDTVEHHRGAADGGLGQQADEHGEVRAADHPEQGRRVGGERPAAAHRVPDRGCFDHPPGIVDTGPAPDHVDWFTVEQGGDDRRGGSGVPDAHFARDEQVSAGIHLLVDNRAADVERARDLVRGQGVLDVDPPAAAADPVTPGRSGPVHSARPARLVGVHTDVHHSHGGTDRAGQDVHGGATGGEIRHHLSGDFRGERGDTRPGDAVVTGDDDGPDALERPWRAGSLRAGKPDRDLLKAPERARWFGQCSLSLPGCVHGVAVEVWSLHSVFPT